MTGKGPWEQGSLQIVRCSPEELSEHNSRLCMSVSWVAVLGFSGTVDATSARYSSASAHAPLWGLVPAAGSAGCLLDAISWSSMFTVFF